MAGRGCGMRASAMRSSGARPGWIGHGAVIEAALSAPQPPVSSGRTSFRMNRHYVPACWHAVAMARHCGRRPDAVSMPP